MKSMVIAAVLITGFLSRIIPHEWNFTPVLALSMFAGAYLSGWKRFAAPLVMMLITDVVLGLYSGMEFTWIGIILCTISGMHLKDNRSGYRIIGCSVGASLAFFIVSNFGVWLYQYPKSWTGLIDCYMMAIPFFRNTLISTVVYSVLMIKGVELIFSRKAVLQKV